MRPRPDLHETEAETKASYCETETKKWFLDHAGFETLIINITTVTCNFDFRGRVTRAIGYGLRPEQNLLFFALCLLWV